jgi:molybdopterin converting factor small subunit
MIEIEVQFFGALRKYAIDGKVLRLQSEMAISSNELKSQIQRHLQKLYPDFLDQQLLMESAIANDTHVLSSDQLINHTCALLILPPVCGG